MSYKYVTFENLIPLALKSIITIIKRNAIANSKYYSSYINNKIIFICLLICYLFMQTIYYFQHLLLLTFLQIILPCSNSYSNSFSLTILKYYQYVEIVIKRYRTFTSVDDFSLIQHVSLFSNVQSNLLNLYCYFLVFSSLFQLADNHSFLNKDLVGQEPFCNYGPV